MGKFKAADVGVMLDIETLALGTRPVITQVALVPWRLDDPEDREGTSMRYLWDFLPIDAQLQLLPQPRQITGGTLNFWINGGDNARKLLSNSLSDDFDDLPAMLRHIVRGFNWMTENGKASYILVARGPQFDVAALESLMKECGIEIPWKYDRVVDLRSVMYTAGIGTDDVPTPSNLIPHQARDDCEYQILCYTAAIKALRA